MRWKPRQRSWKDGRPTKASSETSALAPQRPFLALRSILRALLLMAHLKPTAFLLVPVVGFFRNSPWRTTVSEVARDPYLIEIRPAESDEWSLLLTRAELSD